MEAGRLGCVWNRIMGTLYFFVAAGVLLTHCDARPTLLAKDISISQNVKHLKILDVAKSLNMLMDVSVKDSDLQPYVSSPLTLPPFDSLAPISLPDNNNSPPYCVYPPPSSQSSSPIVPGPTGYGYTPTPTSSQPPGFDGLTPTPPDILPSPPDVSGSPNIFPGPPESTPSPFTPFPTPPYYEPSPPSGNEPSPPSGSEPGPPEFVPSPIDIEPSPPVFEPPVVYPPTGVTPPSTGCHGAGVWCVAKPSVPDPIIQEAMNYACGSGADCDPLQPNGQCFHPNTLLAHASYAFNSYWQRTKVTGGTCSFGGTAILVTVDPSSQGCRFGSS